MPALLSIERANFKISSIYPTLFTIYILDALCRGNFAQVAYGCGIKKGNLVTG